MHGRDRFSQYDVIHAFCKAQAGIMLVAHNALCSTMEIYEGSDLTNQLISIGLVLQLSVVAASSSKQAEAVDLMMRRLCLRK